MWLREMIGNHVKHRFHPHKVDLDPANLKNFFTDRFEFLHANKSYFDE